MTEPKINRLYIHVPFCLRKCDYCAFYSEANAQPALLKRYLDYLAGEMQIQAQKCSELTSIYIGGGTPSIFPESYIFRLFEIIRRHFKIDSNAEITIECNPENLIPGKVTVIAEHANRISLGIQSFNKESRKFIGRQGKLNTIYKGIDLLIANGLENIGCDLIYAIPGQNLADWQQELKIVTDLPIKHISAYSLTYEEGTRLNERKQIESIEEHLDKEADMWEETQLFLNEKGFSRYEISNYSLPEYQCLHNTGIWFGDTYLGLGPAASSFDGKIRWTYPASLKKWLNGAEPEIDKIPPEKRAREVFAMGLRTTAGWDTNLFQQKTSYDCKNWLPEMAIFIDNNMLILGKDRIRCSEKGLLLWNEIAQSLF